MKSEENRDRNKTGKQGANTDQERKQREQGGKGQEGGSPDRQREQKGNRDTSGNR